MIRRRALLAGLLGTLPGCGKAQPAGRIAEPFPLPPLPGNTALRPLGGLEIDRRRLGFGGLSGAHLAPDLTLSAISDIGAFAQFALQLDEDLRPTGMELLRSGRLHDGAGRPLARGYAGDAESLARLPNGDWLVGFERWHRIRRFPDLAGPGFYAEAPPGLAGAPHNAGLETLAVLRDGRWLAIAEDFGSAEAPTLTAAWLGQPGAWMSLDWEPEPGMYPVDAAPLPDGGALVLERGFSLFGGFSGRLLRVAAATLAEASPGTVLRGEEILRIAPPLPVDNFEGAAAVAYRGTTLVALLSDDNENGLQRSLVLLFALSD